MKKDETFEEWYKDQIEKASGELTYGRHSDTEHIKRTYINRIHYVREAWNHQQKKIDELERSVSWLRENCSEWESWGNDLEKVNKSLETKLAKAVKALKFYGDENNWSMHGELEFTRDDIEDYTEIETDSLGRPIEQILVAQIGGKRARQTLAQLGEKGEGE